MINSEAHTTLVDIFDDFDEPMNMESTFCDQVSEQQYQEEIQSETDKALGELCFYLDKNPEVYARVLRKRKQEEVENSGVFSYFKSKMMSFVQGDHYQENLLSSFECLQQAEALKAGMCKTFQYSQELKGTATRYSERLVAKRKLQSFIPEESSENAHASFKRRSVSQKKKNKDLNNVESVCESDSPRIKEVNSLTLGNTLLSNDETKKSDDEDQSNGAENREDRAVDGGETNDHEKKDCANGQSDAGHLPPPLPPPMPAHLLECSVSCGKFADNTPLKTHANKQANNFNSVDDLSLQKPKNLFFSPRASSVPRLRTKNTNYGSIENLSTVSTGSVESLDGTFVTPSENMSVPRSKKRLRSSTSSSSTPKSSFANFQSEITSNPIKRLKVTPVNRSPGLTPLRSKSNILPSEPLQRALHTAMKAKFRNVTTPSPKSDNSSANTSFNSVFTSP